MILATTSQDYIDLIEGRAPRGLRLADSPIADGAILQMLHGVAKTVWKDFSPASWLIVEDQSIVGLCSITKAPVEGAIDLGYGIAPTCQQRGTATRAIADILEWARHDPRVERVTAETGVANVASQRVLQRNGFEITGKRVDAEDGALLCWSTRVK